MRLLEKILSDPDDLLNPPKEVFIDKGVRKNNS